MNNITLIPHLDTCKNALRWFYFEKHLAEMTCFDSASLFAFAVVRSRDKSHWNFLQPGKTDVSCFSYLTHALGQQENTLKVSGFRELLETPT